MALDTEVQICNAALLRAGITKRIETLTDDTPEAEACNAEYEAQRDFLLEDHPWQFAVVYEQWAALSEEPSWYWKYFYELPNDFMSILNLEEEGIHYEITGQDRLATNEAGPLKVRYVKRVEDPTRMPQMFKQALATKLGAVLAMSLTKDMDRAAGLEQRYDRLVADARFNDSQRRSYQPLDATAFIDARRGGPEVIDSEGNLN